MLCPECSDPLRTVRASGVEIDCCSECSGIWLDTGEPRRIDPATALSVGAGTRRIASTARACPRCPDVALWSHPVAPEVAARVAECRLCGGVWVAACDLATVKHHAEARAASSGRGPAGEAANRERPRRGPAGLGNPWWRDVGSHALDLSLFPAVSTRGAASAQGRRRARRALESLVPGDTGHVLRYPRSLWPLVVAAFAAGMLLTVGLVVEQASDAAAYDLWFGRRAERQEAFIGALCVLAQGVAWQQFLSSSARARLAGLAAIGLVWVWIVIVYLADGAELPARQERDLTGFELFLLAALTAVHVVFSVVARGEPRRNALTGEEARLLAAAGAVSHSVPPPRRRA
jgi:Zn-finger nucleic acid-binding protein